MASMTYILFHYYISYLNKLQRYYFINVIDKKYSTTQSLFVDETSYIPCRYEINSSCQVQEYSFYRGESE